MTHRKGITIVLERSEVPGLLFRGFLGNSKVFFLGELLSTAVDDLHLLHWLVPAVSLVVLHLPHHVHPTDHLSEDNVSSIQPAGLLGGDEELRSVGVFP